MPRENKKPLFSIIVPAYNVENYLSECINSVLGQTLPDFELVLVDDGSTDRTGKICDQYKKEHSRNADRPLISVIHQSNSGLSAARNTGVSAANGGYLIFLDGDDYLESDALAIIQDNLEPDLDLLRYQAQEVLSNGQKIPHAEVGFTTRSGVAAFKNLARYHYTENAWLYAYRRAFFTENNFKYAPGRLAEDLGLTPLILARAQTVKVIPDICYNYRQRPGSIMHDLSKIAQRSTDILAQFEQTLPQIAAIPQTAPILHYLVVSFLTGAARLDRSAFLGIYRQSRQAGILRYIHPSSLRSLPRALLLRYFPSLFYRVYHRAN